MKRAGHRILLAAAIAAIAGVAAAAPVDTVVVRGTVAAADATTLSIRTDNGGVTVIALAPGFRVVAATKAAMDAVPSNAMVAVTARPGRRGVGEATAVTVLAEPLRASAEPSHGPEAAPATSVTIGTVSRIGTIRHHRGRTLTVDAHGTTQAFVVADRVPVVALADSVPAQLVAGARVSAVTIRTAGGWPATGQITVGIGGAIPPL